VNLFKILLVVLAAGAAWYAYRKWIAPLPAKRQAETVKDKPKPPAMVEDMKPCPVCGAYVAPDKARHCGRNDCPYPKGVNA
jgi:hypothetical protein